MKNFKNYKAEKYAAPEFEEVEEGIYKTQSPYRHGDEDKEIYVTSLSFEMEPECFGEEDASPRNLTQIPIEGILDEFYVYVTDFYDELNEASETVCYQEFGSSDLERIQRLRTLIGKRFYASLCDGYNEDDEDDEEEYVMVIE